MKELFGCLCKKDFCLAILLLFPSLAECRHLLSVIELGGLYYYDSSDLIVNKTFQVWWRLLLFYFGKTLLSGTRLTYNCAHLRSTKESLKVEFGKKECVKSSSSIKCQMFSCHYRVVVVDT